MERNSELESRSNDCEGKCCKCVEITRRISCCTAEKLLRWSLDFNPDHEGLHQRLSEVAVARGDQAQALNWAERAVGMQPDRAQTHAYLAGLRLLTAGTYFPQCPDASRVGDMTLDE